MNERHAPDGTFESPPSPANRWFFRGFLLFFIVALVAAWIFSSRVVQATRDRAAQTDAALHTAAWAILLYADQRDGRFPTATDDLLDTPFAERLTGALAGPDGTAAKDAFTGRPLTAAEAGVDAPASGEAWRDQVREALLIIEVHPQVHHTLPPTLTASGRPSGQATLDRVNGWMRSASAFLAASGEGHAD